MERPSFQLRNRSEWSRRWGPLQSWSLGNIGIRALFDELEVEPAAQLITHEQLTARFWF